jgi:hypothetical protein
MTRLRMRFRNAVEILVQNRLSQLVEVEDHIAPTGRVLGRDEMDLPKSSSMSYSLKNV